MKHQNTFINFRTTTTQTAIANKCFLKKLNILGLALVLFLSACATEKKIEEVIVSDPTVANTDDTALPSEEIKPVRLKPLQPSGKPQEGSKKKELVSIQTRQEREAVTISAPLTEMDFDSSIVQPGKASSPVALMANKMKSELRRSTGIGQLHDRNIPSYRGEFLQKNDIADREQYQSIKPNSIKLVSEEPVSTFSIDVDTAAYSNIRRVLNEGRLPISNMVRTEELINYFQYDYEL